MYKVYINETPIYLISTKKLQEKQIVADEYNLVARYAGKSKFLLQYIDMLEKTNRFRSVTIHSSDKKALKKDFESLFNVISAAGGLVFNETEQALLIYRRGHWDLPKGKIDRGESKQEAAIREVEEETGIKNIQLLDAICKTRHFYRNKKGGRCIKKTYWYEMRAPNQGLIPQSEEDIEKAIWAELNTFFDEKIKTYKNIVDVIGKYRKSRIPKLF